MERKTTRDSSVTPDPTGEDQQQDESDTWTRQEIQDS